MKKRIKLKQIRESLPILTLTRHIWDNRGEDQDRSIKRIHVHERII